MSVFANRLRVPEEVLGECGGLHLSQLGSKVEVADAEVLVSAAAEIAIYVDNAGAELVVDTAAVIDSTAVTATDSTVAKLPVEETK